MRLLVIRLYYVLDILLDIDHDQLFYLVYEKVKYAEDSLEPHLWTYRSRVTLEHLRQTIQEKETKDKHPVLYEFLQTVCSVTFCYGRIAVVMF